MEDQGEISSHLLLPGNTMAKVRPLDTDEPLKPSRQGPPQTNVAALLCVVAVPIGNAGH